MATARIICLLLGCIIAGQGLVLRYRTPPVVRVREGSTVVLQADIESEEDNLWFYGPGNRLLGEWDHRVDITREEFVIQLYIWRVDRHQSGVYSLKGFDVWSNERLNWSVIVQVVPEHHVSLDSAPTSCVTVDNPERSCVTWEYHGCDVVIRDTDSKILKEYNQCGELATLRSEERERRLLDAAERGDNSEVQTLLLLGTRVNINPNRGGSPLCAAARSGNVDISLLLLYTGASLSGLITDKSHSQIPDIATDIVPYIMSPIHCAALSASIDLVQIFVERGANKTQADNLYNRSQFPNLKVIESVSILKNSSLRGEDENRRPRLPIHYAARSGSLPVVQYFIQLGADPLVRDYFEKTPLFYAARSGSLSLVQYLIQLGADPLVRDYFEKTPLFYAASSGILSLVQYFIQLGADPLARDNVGNTPLFYAARSGSLSVAQYLIQLGANPFARDRVEQTPLFYAASSGSLSVVQYFIQLGIDPLAKNKLGNTPLFPAAKSGSLSLVQYFIEIGVDPLAKNNIGNTPLFQAAASGSLSLVQYFIQLGADPLARDNYDNTPLFYAKRSGSVELVQFFVSLEPDHLLTNS